MNMSWITTTAAAVLFGALVPGAPARAAMWPSVQFDGAMVQHVDCAVGFHIGPAGACILGTEEEHHDTVIENRGAAEGCETKTVHKSDDMGNTETHTKTNCD